MPVSSRAFAAAAARAFVPFGGPTVAAHFANFAALDARLFPLPALRSDDRILIVVPHPDDEVLGCSGILQRAVALGVKARVVFVTNGDGSRTAQIFKTAREPLARDNDLFSLAQARQIEALSALQKLGMGTDSADFLGFPDGGLTTILNGDAIYRSPLTRRNHVAYPRAYAPGVPYNRATLLDLTARIVREWAPTRIFTTHPLDTHRDHAATHALCLQAIARVALPQSPAIAAFLVHYGIWPVPNGLHARLPLAPPAALLQKRDWRSFALSPDEIAAKIAALECYPSQLVSLPRYLRAFVRRNELFELTENSP